MFKKSKKEVSAVKLKNVKSGKLNSGEMKKVLGGSTSNNGKTISDGAAKGQATE